MTTRARKQLLKNPTIRNLDDKFIESRADEATEQMMKKKINDTTTKEGSRSPNLSLISLAKSYALPAKTNA